jgi:hypothetical protein
MKVLNVLALSALMLSSCGDKKKDYSGALGSCTTSAPLETCVEWSYSAKDQTDDPKAGAQSELEASCTTGSSGTWSATGTCATTNSLGSCTTTATSGDATIKGKLFYYAGGALSAENVQTACTETGGTYAAP